MSKSVHHTGRHLAFRNCNTVTSLPALNSDSSHKRTTALVVDFGFSVSNLSVTLLPNSISSPVSVHFGLSPLSRGRQRDNGGVETEAELQSLALNGGNSNERTNRVEEAAKSQDTSALAAAVWGVFFLFARLSEVHPLSSLLNSLCICALARNNTCELLKTRCHSSSTSVLTQFSCDTGNRTY